MDSILFSDLHVDKKPSAIDSSLYKQDGIFVGEAVVKQVLKNGKYRIATHGSRLYDARAVFNLGETVLPTGIAVLATAYNGEAWILGRLRVTVDDDNAEGETDTDRSTTIGSPGDAQLRPHTPKDESITGEVTVTVGGVVKVRSTGATNMTLHPVGERIIQRCQQLLSFSDAYRIESGRLAGKAAGVSFDALTTEQYKNQVGPSRVEVRIKNGKVQDDVVHQFSVETLTTAGGSTMGQRTFGWTVTEDGVWTVTNCSQVNLGDSADEPVVLGNQLVSLFKELIGQMTTLRSALSTAFTSLAAAGTAASSAASAPVPNPASNAAAIGALGASLSSLSPGVSSSATQTSAKLQAAITSYLTGSQASKEKILSDFISAQKQAPTEGIVTE